MIASSLPHRPLVVIGRTPVHARLVGAWRRLVHELRVRNDLRRLGAFDDSTLSDLGVSRGGIEGAVRDGRN